jgi:hypothetical protein
MVDNIANQHNTNNQIPSIEYNDTGQQVHRYIV